MILHFRRLFKITTSKIFSYCFQCFRIFLLLFKCPPCLDHSTCWWTQMIDFCYPYTDILITINIEYGCYLAHSLERDFVWCLHLPFIFRTSHYTSHYYVMEDFLLWIYTITLTCTKTKGPCCIVKNVLKSPSFNILNTLHHERRDL